MHPFGCEAEASLQDLFTYFQRALRRGEWELAAACVPQLLSSSGGLPERLTGIIKAVVCHPHRLRWESVGSPHRLAWFWLQVLEKWTEEKIPPQTRRELEFLLLLEELSSEGIPETLLQDLHKTFSASPSCGGGTAASAQTCLQMLLQKKKTRLAQTLAEFLQDRWGPEGITLQHVFIQHLMKKLERPEQREVEEWAEDLYAVLALMPWQGGGGQLEALLEALWAARAGPLKEERILSCLIRPRCPRLVSMYCSTAVRLQRDLLLRSSPPTQAREPPWREKSHMWIWSRRLQTHMWIWSRRLQTPEIRTPELP